MSNVLKELAATLNNVYFKVLYQEFDSEEFETPMPHENFEIQNGDCLGIVFQLQSKRTLSNG